MRQNVCSLLCKILRLYIPFYATYDGVHLAMQSEWQPAKEGKNHECRFGGTGEQIVRTHCSRLSGGGGVVIAPKVESVGDPMGSR